MRGTLLILLLLAAGCSAEMRYTPTKASKDVAAKAADCSIDVLSTRPDRPFDELGIIDFAGGVVGKNTGQRSGVPDSAGELKEKVRPEVCRAGGDAVISEINGVCQYVRATVVRYRPAAQ